MLSKIEYMAIAELRYRADLLRERAAGEHMLPQRRRDDLEFACELDAEIAWRGSYERQEHAELVRSQQSVGFYARGIRAMRPDSV